MDNTSIAVIIVAAITTIGSVVIAIINNIEKRRQAALAQHFKKQVANHEYNYTFGKYERLNSTNDVHYSPDQVCEWEEDLEMGYWSAVIDCSDDVLLNDICKIVSKVLSAYPVNEKNITTCQVAIIELCRNVADHALNSIAHIEVRIDFDDGDFKLEVISKGTRFSFQDIKHKYSKYSDSKEHGLQNLLSRGELTISHFSSLNTVRFWCLFDREVEVHQFPVIEIGLYYSFIYIDVQRFLFDQWLAILGYNLSGDSSLLDCDKRPVFDIKMSDKIQRNFNSLIEKMIDAWKKPLPVELYYVYNPPKWSRKKFECDSDDVFKYYINLLKKDSRFIFSKERIID